MAGLGSNVLTLNDWAKRRDPNGKAAVIGELLSQKNEILDDMVWQEGNLPTGHRTTVRTGLPTVAWRLLNGGINPSKSVTAQIDEGCGMLEGYSEVDVDLAKLQGDVEALRMSEAHAFVESMSQEAAQTLIYGNSSTAQEEFTGLAARYSTISGATNGSNVISGGGAQSDNSSIWLCGWGPQTIFGIFPKGSEAGLTYTDKGQQTIQTATGIGTGRMEAYVSHWQWKMGIALKDWRFVVRICNIDISNLIAESSNANLIKLMIKAIHRLPSMSGIRPVFYMNRTVFQQLDIQRFNVMTGTTGATQYGGSISYSEVDGKMTPTFRGIPIRIVDQLLETEATVS